MKRTIRNLIRVAVSLMLFTLIQPMSSQAQQSSDGDADGQVCVRGFQDVNGNGIRDLNDAPLQGGISANLLNEQGVVIASALLDNSPTVTRGLICFQFLSVGQYTLEVASADYRPTTPNTLTTIVQGGGTPEVPYVMEFGAHQLSLLSADAASVSVQADPASVITRVLVSSLGAVAALIVMALLGLLIYRIRFRERLRQAQTEAIDYRRPAGVSSTRTTGSMPVVNVHPTSPTDTSEFRPKR